MEGGQRETDERGQVRHDLQRLKKRKRKVKKNHLPEMVIELILWKRGEFSLRQTEREKRRGESHLFLSFLYLFHVCRFHSMCLCMLLPTIAASAYRLQGCKGCFRCLAQEICLRAHTHTRTHAQKDTHVTHTFFLTLTFRQWKAGLGFILWWLVAREHIDPIKEMIALCFLLALPLPVGLSLTHLCLLNEK